MLLVVLLLGCRPQSTSSVGIDAGPDAAKGDGDSLDSGSEDSGTSPELCSNRNEYVVYGEPGPDGTWGTEDDVAGGREDAIFGDDGRLDFTLFYSAPGADLAWGTSDDVGDGGHRFGYHANGHLSSIWSTDGPGGDGVWATDDDTPTGEDIFTFEENANRWRREYVVYGLNRALDPEDEIGRRAWVDPHDGHQIGNMIVLLAAGPDETWWTRDDLIERRWTWTYDDTGRLSGVVVYNTPGPDLIWGSEDDVVGFRWEVSCLADEVVATFSAGPAFEGGWYSDGEIIQQKRLHNAAEACSSNLCGLPFF